MVSLDSVAPNDETHSLQIVVFILSKNSSNSFFSYSFPKCKMLLQCFLYAKPEGLTFLKYSMVDGIEMDKQHGPDFQSSYPEINIIFPKRFYSDTSKWTSPVVSGFCA